VRGREDLLRRLRREYEVREEHIRYIAEGFMLLFKPPIYELVFDDEDKMMIRLALQHILTGEGYGYLRDLLDQGRIDEFRKEIYNEARRILDLKGYRL